jgi:tRNA G18 (ribose-2'-O)-methylase SpoU
MPVFEIDSLDDSRVWAYRNLKDHELARQGDRFIAEGRHVALRLLSSAYACESVLCSRKRWEMVQPHTPPHVDAFIAPAAVVDAIVGYKFHSGVLAVGRRRDPEPLSAWMGRQQPDVAASSAHASPLTLVICPHTRNCDNLGSIIRNAAALGADGLICGEDCTDPFWRRTIRVSMGTIFHLPLHVSADLASDMRALRECWGVSLLATVVDDTATLLHHVSRPPRIAIVLGSEDQGLGEKWTSLCDQRVTLAMHHGTDSLNVATAAAVFLHHLAPR